MQVKDIPNFLTGVRLVLVAPLVYVLLEEEYFLALWIILGAGASDGLDGFLAKHYQWQSRLGSILDPIADKLLLISSFVVLALLGHIPIWLVGLALSRDVALIMGSFAYHFFVEPLEIEPTLLSKVNTLCQILLIVIVIANQLSGLDMSRVAEWLIYLVALTIVLSGMQYAWHWGSQAWRVSKAQKASSKSCRQ